MVKTSNNNKRLSVYEPSSSGVLRTTRKSLERTKKRKSGAEQQKINDTIARSSSHTSSHISQSDREEVEETKDEGLVLNVTVEDRNITRTVTPRKGDFVKDPSIGGVKGRVGWAPKRDDERRKPERTQGNHNRYGNKHRERNLRHDYVTTSDMSLLTYLNRNPCLYDISEDVLAQLRSITLKNLNNLERVFRKLRRGDKYSHYPSISRNIERNFRI